MSHHLREFRSAWPLLSFALLAAGCGDDSSSVTLELTAPAADQVLTMRDDDVDPDRAGLQFDVEGTSSGIDRGTLINLFIDGQKQAVSGRIDKNGKVVIPDVTLPPGEHAIFLETTTGSIASDEEQEYTLQALEITSPENGAELTRDDDVDATEPGVQIEVMVTAFALDLSEPVTLLRDGAPVGDPEEPDSDGHVAFTGIRLSDGEHTLQARAGEGDDAIESTEISVDVGDSCAGVTFISPALSERGDDRVSLGGAGQCPSGNDVFTTTVEIATNAGNLRPVQLFVNGQLIDSTTVDGSTATFEDVPLARRTSANTIEVRVENREGVICREPFPADVFVDCAGVDCMIASPTPVGYIDGDAELSLYLNAALRGDDGFDVEVDTSAEVTGRDVQLIVDGNTRNPLRATADDSGAIATAIFRDLDLREGEHRIEALCTDAAGNETYSPEVQWIVDLTPCGVDISDPADGAVFVPADDEDATTDGTQVVMTTAVTGDDCARQRAAQCDPDDGLGAETFAAHDGTATVLSTVTLEDSEPEQSLCVEIEDRAANTAFDSVSVAYYAIAPRVAFESPESGDSYNAEGNDGHVADADPAGPAGVCEAEFSIACSELGLPVELFYEGDDDPLASADCEEPASGDPALPSGYHGRARLTAPVDDGDGEVATVAKQTLRGTSTAELTGTSAAITVFADCSPPEPSFTGDPCNAAALNQLTLAEAAARDFGLSDATEDIAFVELSAANTDGTTAMPEPDATTPASAPFSAVGWEDVDLGGTGTVTISVVVSDEAANVAELECSTNVVPDLPAIVSFTAPVEGAVLRPVNDCNPATPAVFEARVQATLDKQADRVATVLVNGTDSGIAVPVSAAGAIDVCVPVPDNVANQGASSVTLHVESTLGSPPGTAEQTRTVNVVLSGLNYGITIDDLLPPALADLAHRDGVVTTWALPAQDYPGQLVSYELRCAATALALTADASAKNFWWAAADPVDLDGLTPADEPEALLAFRPEEPRHCLLRGTDVAGQSTQITESTDLTLKLRSTVIATGTTTNQGLGVKVSPAGDIDGDGIDDLLIGGFGRTELVFGTEGDPTSAPRVVFTSVASGFPTAPVGIGDFNGDTVDDFAIGNPVVNTNSGRVSIYFGRPRDQWPATIDIDTACNADICLEGEANSRLGRVTASLGDFDDDGTPDLALGSPGVNQVYVILGGSYEVRPCSECRAAGESCVDAVCTRDLAPAAGQPSFWLLRASLPTGDFLDPAGGSEVQGFQLVSTGSFGASLAGMGDFDTEPGEDLVIGASVARQVHFLSGRPHVATGIQALTTSALGLPDVTTGVPDGMPISAQDLSGYGFVVANVGDFYEAVGSAQTKFDLGIARVNADESWVAPGDLSSASDSGFSAPLVHIAATGNIGQSIATSWDPAYGLLGDLDGDGEPELCVGTRTAVPHDILLWYPDRFAEAAGIGDVTRTSAISLQAQTAGTQELMVQYIGDINGDGHLDVAVGDWRPNTNTGRVVLFY